MKTIPRVIPILCVALLLVSCATNHSHFSNKQTVSDLIEQLASPVPPKYTNGEWTLRSLDDENGYIHPRVARARLKLVAMGTGIYAELVKHLGDSRYSYSIVIAAWNNETVGQMIEDIMADGIEFHGYEYKMREYPEKASPHPTSFYYMVNKIGWEKYAKYAALHTKEELQIEFIKWHIEQERLSGFVSKQQETKILGPYLKRLSELAGKHESPVDK